MLTIDIVTIHPGLFQGVFGHSILKRAIASDCVKIRLINLRDYATDKHRSVDDYQYGGGAGMVMMIEPLVRCLEDLQKDRNYDEIIFLTPDGTLFNQHEANSLSLKENLLLICGHYKGVDERFRQHYVTREISIGNYVLSGGEPAAVILCDAVIRLLPGVLNDETSALSDSFQDDLLSAPVYTRPAVFRGFAVPPVLLSGHEEKIAQWRHEQALERTRLRRPDLLK
ncbi:MAG: tRNA (guanosine(37)-N1)-methyltransferase TrmD [Bacteroidia bacterium]|nr:tRNA (guanosine(37)-N1)-methyltransferase TrmD [Bacteroidia bacterium]MCZ2276766.1 tRNA (guanosine(37)-N1)-methyltransferase TrmD [Bacteroidia bacterium]